MKEVAIVLVGVMAILAFAWFVGWAYEKLGGVK
jgi:hypothetical protein